MERPERDKLVPPIVSAVLKPALQVGALSGVSGLAIGGIAGVIRSSTPVLFATASGFQCFALGTTFWVTRSTILHTWQPPQTTLTPGPSLPLSDRTTASTLAGALTGGAVGGLIRGRANILPGTIMFSLFGYLGQLLYNTLDERHTLEVAAGMEGGGAKKNWVERVAEMKWSPMKVLSDEEYESMLRERLVGVEAEIQVLDERIRAVKAEAEAGRTEDVKNSS